jgi:parallel beta-helix repeat protein
MFVKFLIKILKASLVCLLLMPSAFGREYYVAQTKTASDSNPGTKALPFRTISKATCIAEPGDTVLVYPGIYRECVRPARGGTSRDKMIIYKSLVPHKAVVKGSELVQFNWKPINTPSIKGRKASCYVASLPQNIFKENPRLKGTIFNPFKIPVHVGPYLAPDIRYSTPSKRHFSPLQRGGSAKNIYSVRKYEYSFGKNRKNFPELVLGEVFVRGIPLRQVRTLAEVKADKGTFCVLDDGKQIAVNFTQWTYSNQLEVTVRQQVFAPKLRGLGFIKVEGFVFEHAANTGSFPHMGMVSVRSGHDWIIENNIIRYAGTLGVDIGGEIAGHWDHISKGKVRDINEGPWSKKTQMPRWEKSLKPGDVRKHWFYHDDPVVRNNQVINNYVYGNGHAGISAVKAKDIVIAGNIIEKNNRRLLTPNHNRDINFEEAAGIKILFVKRAIIRNNLVRNNDGEARGIWIDLENEDCSIFDNICLSNEYGIDVEAENPNIKIYNNIVAFNRIDGLSHRTIDFGWKRNTTAHWIGNLSIYNGNFGYAASIQKKIPKNIIIKNNIFYGNQFGAIRFLFPAINKKYGNIIAGNVIGAGGRLQLMSGPPSVMTKSKMISEIKNILNIHDDKNKIIARLNDGDWWFAGLCDMKTFDKITGYRNYEQRIEPISIYSSQNKFKEILPLRYPESIFFDNLKVGVILKFGNSPWKEVSVDRVGASDKDYFGNSYDSDKVIPGPFKKEVYNENYIQIWPGK